MANKTPYSIADQIALLKQRGMLFNDEQSAHHFLENISYYRFQVIVENPRFIRAAFHYIAGGIPIFRF